MQIDKEKLKKYVELDNFIISNIVDFVGISLNQDVDVNSIDYDKDDELINVFYNFSDSGDSGNMDIPYDKFIEFCNNN